MCLNSKACYKYSHKGIISSKKSAQQQRKLKAFFLLLIYGMHLAKSLSCSIYSLFPQPSTDVATTPALSQECCKVITVY